MSLHCPDCDAQLLARRQGPSYSLRCSSCSWSVATTFPHPFASDSRRYTIIVTSLGRDPSRSLIALNRRFTHGIARTREWFSAGERPLMSGTAREAWYEAHRLRAEGIPFRFDPEYPYDLDDPELAEGYSHDWRPVEKNPF